MSLKEFLNSLSKEDNEKNLQKITDSILDFMFIKTPRAFARGAVETYSWMKDGFVFSKDSIIEAYKRNSDAITLARLLQEKDRGKSFCVIDYRAGEIICKYSIFFYNKKFMQYFCEDPNKAPKPSVIIKRDGSRFHKGYCVCSTREL
ncbi:MAG: hypothetical protein N3G19_03430 [Candidatus Pacearchaeota archaeon]|nr:hypothetical protein [Candidatus Pacearchaeota archaeon]